MISQNLIANYLEATAWVTDEAIENIMASAAVQDENVNPVVYTYDADSNVWATTTSGALALENVNSFLTANSISVVPASLLSRRKYSTYLNAGEWTKVCLALAMRCGTDISDVATLSTKTSSISVTGSAIYRGVINSIFSSDRIDQFSPYTSRVCGIDATASITGLSYQLAQPVSTTNVQYFKWFKMEGYTSESSQITFGDTFSLPRDTLMTGMSVDWTSGSDHMTTNYVPKTITIRVSYTNSSGSGIISQTFSSDLGPGQASVGFKTLSGNDMWVEMREGDNNIVSTSKSILIYRHYSGTYSPACGAKSDGTIESTKSGGGIALSISAPSTILKDSSSAGISVSGGAELNSVQVDYYVKPGSNVDWANCANRVPQSGVIEGAVNAYLSGNVNGYSAIQVDAGQGSGSVQIDSYTSIPIDVITQLDDCVSIYDSYDATDIASVAGTTALYDFINKKTCLLDSYLANYIDFTGYVIVDAFLDSINNYLISGNMKPCFGLDENTSILGGTVKQIYDGNHPRQGQFYVTFAKARVDVEYRIVLFETMQKCFSSSDYLSTAASFIAEKMNSLFRTVSVALQNVSDTSGKRALLLGYAESDNAYAKVEEAINLAVSYGATSLASAYDVLSSLSPELATYISDTGERQMISEILESSIYDGARNFVEVDAHASTTDVNYLATWNQRLGSSIFSSGGADSEIQANSSGGLFISPALFSASFHSGDLHLPSSNFFCPFTKSYLEISQSEVPGVYYVNWYAKFAGGTDKDAYQAVAESYDEFKSTITLLAKLYLGSVPTLRFPSVPSALSQSDADIATITGYIGMVGASAAVGAAIGTVIPVVGTAAGAIAGELAGVVLSIWQASNPDFQKGRLNTAYHLSSCWSLDASECAISDAGVLSATGDACFTVYSALFGWAINNGMFRPVSNSGTYSNKVGVLAPSSIPAKYVYVGNKEDYTPLAVTVGVVMTAFYSAYYFNGPSVRARSFLPAIIGGGAISVAGTGISKALETKVATESSLVSLTDFVNSYATEDASTLEGLGAKLNTSLASLEALTGAISKNQTELLNAIGRGTNPTFFQ